MTIIHKLKIFYRQRIPFHIHHKLPKPILISNPSAQGLTLSANVDQSNGIVNWVVTNGTSETKYVVIYRGAVFDNFTVEPYPFGNAYYPDYAGKICGQTVSFPIQNLNNIPPYSLGMINNKIVAFVFQVPPNSQLTVAEGGFNGVKQLIYTLVEVTPEKLHTYLVFWCLFQWFDYMAQTGFNVTPVTLPWVVKMYNFTTNVNMPTAFPNLVIKVV